MKSSESLKIGEIYEIRYAGFHGYDAYSGQGTYNGEKDDIDGPCFGFTLPDNSKCLFPLEDIFNL